jgi:hypothetical protein
VWKGQRGEETKRLLMGGIMCTEEVLMVMVMVMVKGEGDGGGDG